MATVSGMTAAEMQKIAEETVVSGEVVGDDLILRLRSELTINAGPVRGLPGAPGGTDEAFATWISMLNSNTRQALADLFDQNKRRVGLKRNAVSVGNNYAGVGWTSHVCTEFGLIDQNFSYAGPASFTGANNYLTQLQAAAASTGFDNDDVALVMISDASYNIRAWNDTGTTVNISTQAAAAFSYAKSTFPNARILCIPVIWPADPDIALSGVSGGYQNVWPYALSETISQIKGVAPLYGVEVVEDTHTWLTGISGVMATNTAVNPNSSGHYIIARWINAHIKGNRTRADSSWVNILHLPTSTVSTDAAVPRFKCRREGWNVLYTGGFRTTNLAFDGPVDLAQFPVGFRPAGYEQLSIRINGGAMHFPGEIRHDGTLRVWDGMLVNRDWLCSGSFTMY